jgi:hypothetical protein
MSDTAQHTSVSIRDATEADVPFLAWVMLAASRSHVPVGVWEYINGTDEERTLRYLADLAGRGIPVEPTVWLERGSRADLAGLLRDRGWAEAVVKPAVSASAHRTWRAPSSRSDQAALDRMLGRSDVMVQRLNRRIGEVGEWSLVFLGFTSDHPN